MTLRALIAASALVLAAVAGTWTSLPSSPQDARDGVAHVRIDVTTGKDTLAPGAASEILFTFAPSKGFHVNAIPAMSVQFDSGSAARPVGAISLAADTATGYLDAATPARQPFALAKDAARGRTALRGTLTYFYCSDAEGWCRRERLPFTVPVQVR